VVLVRVLVRKHLAVTRVRIVVVADVDTGSRTPGELREHFRQQVREAVQRAHAAGRLELAVAEEFVRAVPATERRR